MLVGTVVHITTKNVIRLCSGEVRYCCYRQYCWQDRVCSVCMINCSANNWYRQECGKIFEIFVSIADGVVEHLILKVSWVVPIGIIDGGVQLLKLRVYRVVSVGIVNGGGSHMGSCEIPIGIVGRGAVEDSETWVCPETWVEIMSWGYIHDFFCLMSQGMSSGGGYVFHDVSLMKIESIIGVF